MSTQLHSRFLDLRALVALEHMRFTTRHRIEGAYSGRHQSRQQGGAGEFVDFREYSGSEDLRRLDWKVLARTGKAFVRLHQDETNLLCTLALDASGSMLFGARGRRDPTGSKLQYVQYLATALSYVISRGQDQVGLAVLDDQLRESMGPGGTPSHVTTVQDAIANLTTRPLDRMQHDKRAIRNQEVFIFFRVRFIHQHPANPVTVRGPGINRAQLNIPGASKSLPPDVNMRCGPVVIQANAFDENICLQQIGFVVIAQMCNAGRFT